MKRRAGLGALALAGLLALGACGGTTVVEAGSPVKASDSTPGSGGSTGGELASRPDAGSPGQGIAVGEPNPSAPDAPTMPSEPEDPKPELVTPRPGMANVHPIAWDKAEVLGPRKVRIHFYGGVAPCHVLSTVKVKYLPEAVAITLYSGSDPAKPDAMCIEIAKLMAVDVDLAEDLDGREVVDTQEHTEAPAAEAPAGKRAPTPDEGAKVVTPRPGMADPHPQSFDKAVVTGDRSLRIYFTSGVEPCTVLDSVQVAYEAGRIVVTMASGRDPSVAPDTACIMLAEYRAVDVTLTEDVGDREIVDGTAA